ncbi:hypothetical protein HY772_03610, partial [Candidatus Woesearchaeota archaeon]|nr:hypothetical protein [Candidatus Woesearchaeota archaeon]
MGFDELAKEMDKLFAEQGKMASGSSKTTRGSLLKSVLKSTGGRSSKITALEADVSHVLPVHTREPDFLVLDPSRQQSKTFPDSQQPFDGSIVASETSDDTARSRGFFFRLFTKNKTKNKPLPSLLDALSLPSFDKPSLLGAEQQKAAVQQKNKLLVGIPSPTDEKEQRNIFNIRNVSLRSAAKPLVLEFSDQNVREKAKVLEQKQQLLNKLFSTLAQKQQEVEEAETKLTLQRKHLSLAQQESFKDRDKLRKQLQDTQKNLKSLEEERILLLRDVTALETRRSTLEREREHKDMRERESRLTAQAKELDPKSTRISTQCERLQQDTEKLLTKKSQIELQITQANERLADVTNLVQLKEQEFNINERKKEFEALRAKVNALNEQVNQKKLALHAHEDAVINRIAELERRERALEVRKGGVRRGVADAARYQFGEEQESLEDTIAELNDQIESLQKTKAELEQQIQHARAELQTLAKAKTDGLGRLGKEQKELFERELDLKKSEEDYLRKKALLAQKEEDLHMVDKLLGQKQSLLKEKEREIVKRIEEADSELHTIQSKKEKAMEDLGKAQQALDDVSTDKATLASEVRSLKNEFGTLDVS